jgi:regulator of sigma E protease
MTAVIFLVVLSFLVVIHELGHFLSAKWAGMKVEEFGIGYPPRAVTVYTDSSGTAYTINWLPFGGFVKLYGEDGESQKRANIPVGKAFYTKAVWMRLLVVLAGAIVNFAFGVVAFGAIYSVVGIPTEFEYVKIEEVVTGSPAEQAGLEVGDRVTHVVVQSEESRVKTVEEFVGIVGEHRGETIGVKLEGQEAVVPVYVRTEAEVPEDEGSIGVVISSFGLVKYPWWQMPFRGMVVGLNSAVNFGGLLLVALGEMVGNLVTMGQVPQEVAGPVGIVHTVSREGLLDEGLLAIINFAAILSINLAIVNVLPIPALDGGRALFLLMEMISGRRVPATWERVVNTVGFAFLITLIVLISVRDVANVLKDELFQNWVKQLMP